MKVKYDSFDVAEACFWFINGNSDEYQKMCCYMQEHDCSIAEYILAERREAFSKYAARSFGLEIDYSDV